MGKADDADARQENRQPGSQDAPIANHGGSGVQDRRMAIVRDMSDGGGRSVAELAMRYGVSQVTIRNDLRAMEKDGLMRRVHGGVAPQDETSLSKRLHVRYAVKLRIARAAADLVAPGETIFIESGSTNALLARQLGMEKDVVIVTNSAFIARDVREFPRARVILLGGHYQPDSEVCVGPLTRQALAAFHVDKLFIGTDGFSEEDGFTCLDLMRAEAVTAMAGRANQVIVLTDSDKFGRRGVATQVSLEQVSHVITDTSLPAEIPPLLAERGVRLTLVSGEET